MDNKQLAQGIASLGRGGDTTLMHMRPEEVQQLQAISRAGGGEITINPDTGMPEAFLGDFFSAFAPTLAGIGVGAMFPPAYAPYLAAGAGALTKVAQGETDPLSIAMGGLGGYGGSGIGQGIVGASAPASSAAAVPEPTPAVPLEPTQVYTPINTAGGVNMSTGQALGGVGQDAASIANFGANVSNAPAPSFNQPTSVFSSTNTTMAPPYASSSAQPGGLPTMTGEAPVATADLPPLTGEVATTAEVNKPLFQQGFEYGQNQVGKFGQGLKNIFTDENSRSKFFTDLGGGNETYGMFKTALPVAGAGLEAGIKGQYEDMPMAGDYDIYDPYSRLNLSGDTGLRLLASGGQIKRYANGGETSKDYGVNPQYKLNFGSSSMPALGLNNNNDGRMRVPVKGFIDVAGHFKASPDGDITDVEYEKEYSAMWNPQDKYGSSDISNFAANQMGQIPAGVGALLGNVVSNIGEARDSAPSESQTLKTEPLAKGGRVRYAEGGISALTPEDGKMLNGNGDGVSDDIPATIEGEQEAALSDGEFIVPARIVSELGNGSSDAGAKKLYEMIDRIQAARQQTIGDNKQYAKDTNAERYLPV